MKSIQARIAELEKSARHREQKRERAGEGGAAFDVKGFERLHFANTVTIARPTFSTPLDSIRKYVRECHRQTCAALTSWKPMPSEEQIDRVADALAGVIDTLDYEQWIEQFEITGRKPTTAGRTGKD